MRRIGIVILAVLIPVLSSSVAQATEESGTYTITGIRIHTSEHSNSLAQNNAVVYVSGGLGNGCTGGWYPVLNATSTASNAATQSILTAAFLAGRQVKIWYDPSRTSPWGEGTVCVVTAVQVN